ncbi:MAG: DUF72 domain-containing protein [Candidatus Eremiobacteraeota bacterium]|nr:DUF72 domain-containing protein [Candidatus Eremiobacteraeota bacterium]
MEQLPLWAADRVEPISLGAGLVRVGTCGYSYRDWVGRFYPRQLRADAMLEYYARHFSTVEIDASYYRVPSEATIASLHRRTPPEFRFTAKLPGSLTHVPSDVLRPSLDDAEAFRTNFAPLVDSKKLGAVLMQFPNSFRPSARAEEHLGRLREALPDLQLVAEFRHRGWQTAATFALLGRLGIAWCNVDEPHFQTLLHASNDVVGDLGYVRLHGRNAKMWWKGDSAERYEYDYTPEELSPWIARVSEMADAARETYVMFNNHRFGHSAANAQTFAEMLR